MLSTQRSGSHFVKSFIESHFAGVACSGEVLEQPHLTGDQSSILRDRPDLSHFWIWYERQAAAGKISVAPDKRYEAFETYLATLVEMTLPHELVVDAKYNSLRSLSGYRDTDYGSYDFVSFITSRQIPVLHLIRKNILRVVVSAKLAQHTGIRHRLTERCPDEMTPKIRLNPKNILFDIRYAFKLTQDYQNRFAGYAGYEEIVYEELVEEQTNSQPGIALRTLAHFLGEIPVPEHRVELPSKKRHRKISPKSWKIGRTWSALSEPRNMDG